MLNKLKLLIVFAFLFLSFHGVAQNYRTGIGFRLGGLASGITVKHFVNSSAAIEGIAGFAHHAFILTGLYEVHRNIPNAPGLQWFFGGGGHIGFFRYDGYYYVVHTHGNQYYYFADDPEGSHAIFGLDFILGLDYKFTNAPIDIALDIKPFVDFFDGAEGFFDGAFTFRFVF